MNRNTVFTSREASVPCFSNGSASTGNKGEAGVLLLVTRAKAKAKSTKRWPGHPPETANACCIPIPAKGSSN